MAAPVPGVAGLSVAGQSQLDSRQPRFQARIRVQAGRQRLPGRQSAQRPATSCPGTPTSGTESPTCCWAPSAESRPPRLWCRIPTPTVSCSICRIPTRPLPNLTLNYGVRYEYFTPIVERDNLVSNFDPGANGGRGGAADGEPGEPRPSSLRLRLRAAGAGGRHFQQGAGQPRPQQFRAQIRSVLPPLGPRRRQGRVRDFLSGDRPLGAVRRRCR